VIEPNRPRVGHIPFLNCHPLHFGLVATEAIHGLELVRGTPAELARMMLAGELEVAPMSSIEYLRHADDFLLLPGLAIGARGEVQSVQLVGKVAPEQLDGPVAMTDSSLTSHVLLALLLKELWAVDVPCFAGAVEIPAVFEHAQAALLIGDEALRIRAAAPGDLQLTDLGSAWARLTGLPMTYAVWAVRREFAEGSPALLGEVARGLSSSLAWSLQHLDAVIADAAARDGLAPERLAAYFANLDYDLDEPAERGLLAFARRACAHGHLARVPTLEYAAV
jgi:chorismate dehydratase